MDDNVAMDGGAGGCVYLSCDDDAERLVRQLPLCGPHADACEAFLHRAYQPEAEAEALGVRVSIDSSAGKDGAVIVFIDTEFEPDGTPGLRVILNDADIFVGTPYEAEDD